MAPNGATSRKSAHIPQPTATRAFANTIAPAPAPAQKARDSKLLGNLFEDLEDITSPKLKPEVKGNLPVVKKLGNWDSESGNGMSCAGRFQTIALVLTRRSRKEKRETIAGQATTLRHHEGLLHRPPDEGHTQDAQMQPLQADRHRTRHAEAYREVS